MCRWPAAALPVRLIRRDLKRSHRPPRVRKPLKADTICASQCMPGALTKATGNPVGLDFIAAPVAIVRTVAAPMRVFALRLVWSKQRAPENTLCGASRGGINLLFQFL